MPCKSLSIEFVKNNMIDNQHDINIFYFFNKSGGFFSKQQYL
jgi:hypothetical protein